MNREKEQELITNLFSTIDAIGHLKRKGEPLPGFEEKDREMLDFDVAFYLKQLAPDFYWRTSLNVEIKISELAMRGITTPDKRVPFFEFNYAMDKLSYFIPRHDIEPPIRVFRDKIEDEKFYRIDPQLIRFENKTIKNCDFTELLGQYLDKDLLKIFSKSNIVNCKGYEQIDQPYNLVKTYKLDEISLLARLGQSNKIDKVFDNIRYSTRNGVGDILELNKFIEKLIGKDDDSLEYSKKSDLISNNGLNYFSYDKQADSPEKIEKIQEKRKAAIYELVLETLEKTDVFTFKSKVLDCLENIKEGRSGGSKSEIKDPILESYKPPYASSIRYRQAKTFSGLVDALREVVKENDDGQYLYKYVMYNNIAERMNKMSAYVEFGITSNRKDLSLDLAFETAKELHLDQRNEDKSISYHLKTFGILKDHEQDCSVGAIFAARAISKTSATGHTFEVESFLNKMLKNNFITPEDLEKFKITDFEVKLNDKILRKYNSPEQDNPSNYAMKLLNSRLVDDYISQLKS